MDIDVVVKNCFVFGASKGIGEECAKKLAITGHLVHRFSRSLKDKTETKILSDKDKYIIKNNKIDLSNLKTLKSFLNKQNKNKNYPDIIIFSNGGPKTGNILDIKEKDIIDNVKQHFISMNEIIKFFLPYMLNNNFGRIINISSISSRQPIDNLDLSNFIRPGLASIYKSLSNKYSKYNITFNTVSPGTIQTDRLNNIASIKANQQKISKQAFFKKLKSNIPMQKIGSVSEVASLVHFLCSNESSYISGVNIPVDGGANKSYF